MTLDLDTPLGTARRSDTEQLVAWCSEWSRRLYGPDPLAADTRRRRVRMPTPKTHVWMTVEAAHDAVGDAAVAVLRVIRERGRPGRPPLPAAEVPRIANWYLVRRVADQVEREMRRCPVPDEELAALRPPPAAMEEITIEKIATRQAMEAIPPAERRAVSLASWGYDGEERARHQRISLVTERKRLSRGRAHLRAAAAA